MNKKQVIWISSLAIAGILMFTWMEAYTREVTFSYMLPIILLAFGVLGILVLIFIGATTIYEVLE